MHVSEERMRAHHKGKLCVLTFLIALFQPVSAFSNDEIGPKKPITSLEYQHWRTAQNISRPPTEPPLQVSVLFASNNLFNAHTFNSEFSAWPWSIHTFEPISSETQNFNRTVFELVPATHQVNLITSQRDNSEFHIQKASFVPKLPTRQVTQMAWGNLSGLWLFLSVLLVAVTTIYGVLMISRWQQKRRAKRYPCSISAMCSVENNKRQTVQIEDISMIGCCMRVLHDDLNPGTEINLDIAGIDMMGQIVWRNENLSGVEFSSPLRLHVVCSLAADNPR